MPKTITVVLDDNYPPYVFRDASGQIQGILKDTWALWEARTGVAVKLQAMDWANAQQFMQAGRADVIDTLFRTPDRLAIYDFTAPYAQLEVSIFFHKSIGGIVDTASLKGFTVGVKAGDACLAVLTRHGVDTVKAYPSYAAVISAAAEGDLRVFCMDKPPAVHLLNQRGVEQDFRQSIPLYTGEFHRAVRKGNGAMLQLLDDGFGRITPAEYQAIEQKWLGKPIEQYAETVYVRYVGDALGGAALLALLLGGWSYTLRQRVVAKTAALTASLTELRAAQSQLQANSERFQKIASRLPGMVYQFLLRPDGSFCFPFASPSIRDIYRVSPESVLEDSAAVVANIHPADLARVLESIRLSAQNLTPWQHEYRVKFDDGTVRWLFGNSLPERLADGSVLWHGFITDITERRKADDKLRQLSRITEQSPVAIVITNLAGTIEYANPMFTEVTGYAADELDGCNPRILQSGLTPLEVYRDMWANLKAGRVWHGELVNRKKSGEFFTEQVVIAPVVGAYGKVTHYVALKEDITERRKLDQALQASLQEKVALLNEVHHRVKNNLQVITSLLRLEAGRSSQPDTKAVLQEMQGRIRAMALLHESLYRSGTFASVDLASYLKQLATQAFRAQGSGAVRLTLLLEPVLVSMDLATPCGLLVNELISNALKHAFPPGQGGEIQVALHAVPGAVGSSPQWCLRVSDTGVGLPADFEVRRAQSLGMQLASDLAQQLGGTLVVGTALATDAGASFAINFSVGGQA
ncbi:MAG: transporter substrate-binding domain-containing protein [Rhodoferax sp.]|nr:transporter substrate-binding domain-containing protein [Rhodoferax sp.]